MKALTHLYFAYGSNLNFEQMANRCPGAKFFARGFLGDYQFLIFDRGYATLVPAENESTWGGVWKISREHLHTLDTYEGVSSNLYQRESIAIRMPDRNDQSINCQIYFSTNIQQGTANPGYMEAVIIGARNCRLPGEYIKKLKTWL